MPNGLGLGDEAFGDALGLVFAELLYLCELGVAGEARVDSQASQGLPEMVEGTGEVLVLVGSKALLLLEIITTSLYSKASSSRYSSTSRGRRAGIQCSPETGLRGPIATPVWRSASARARQLTP